MAEITLSSLSYCRPYRAAWGSPPTKHVPASTGFSTTGAISVGQVVALDIRGVSTCFHKVYGITASSFATVSTQGAVVGIAASSHSGNTSHGNSVTVWEANPFVEFRAQTKGGAIESSHIGSARTLAWDSTLSIHYVDLAGSTAADNRVLVTDVIDSLGDTGGAVAFRFMAQQRGSTGNSSSPWLAFYNF
jgi:hypothetical protein